ncbi:hypothetical protein BXZ70DRAFT_742410 [Cristinia sonorae]|uniref:Uncharacterized protein n=1 Tax=Cristinia sonorae TaxID=1940300 RepID=A0A8K0XSH0_9AGAR|nr:hypothetical protein BXZ70DRAFT_742410 [Cristinia sonorae]
MALTQEELHQHALELMYNSGHVIGIIPQSILYGIYSCLISMSSYMMLKKGLKTKSRRFLFGMTLAMYAYATLYMVMSTANLILFIKGWFLDIEARGPHGDAIQLFSAIGLINYVLTDGVVVWRAWVLCRDDSRNGLMVSLGFLALACLSVTSTIAIRIGLFVATKGQLNKHLSRAIDITQVANLVFSLLTNFTATSIVALKAWRHRRFFTEMRVRDSKTHSSRIMALLIESGFFYCISLITVLVATVIRLPVGTFGDLYTPVNVQLAGIYPIVVLLLVNHERSLDHTMFVNSVAVHVSGMASTGNPTRSAARPMSTVLFRSNPSRASSQSHTTITSESGSPGMSFDTKSTRASAEQSFLEKTGLPDVPCEPFEVSLNEVLEIKSGV